MKTLRFYLKTNYHLLLLALIISSLTSCHQALSRAEAEKQIKQKLQLPQDEFKEIELKQLQTQTAVYTNNQTGAKYEQIDSNHDKSVLFYDLEREGLINIRIGKTALFDSPYGYMYEKRQDYQTFFIATFTDKAQPYVQGNSVKVSTIEFGEITGIVERKEFNAAEVQYTTKRTSLTPFAIFFRVNEEVFNHSASFTKYDDGWRIE